MPSNTVEYEAILLGLQKLRAIGVQTCVLRTDSKLLAGQIEKECIAREPTLERYLTLVRRMESYFKGFIVEHIYCNKNTEADELCYSPTTAGSNLGHALLPLARLIQRHRLLHDNTNNDGTDGDGGGSTFLF
jgi:ribonuclease HI